MAKEKNLPKKFSEPPGRQREFERVDFSTTAWVFALSLPENLRDGTPLRLEAKNMSPGGLKFQTNKKIPLFTKLSMQLFARSGEGAPITIAGKVVRVEEVDEGLPEKTYGIAMNFEGLGDLEKAQLIAALGPEE